MGRALVQLDPRVQCLGRFIKHWALQRRINNRSEGTLSTYTLILQLFFYLQTRDPPVLPRVVDILTVSLDVWRERNAINGGHGGPFEATAVAPKAVNALVAGPEMDEASGELRALPFLANGQEICKEGRFPGAGQNKESL